MRVSELVAQSGVPLATVKYYLREGLLMNGTSTGATAAQYSDLHVRRLALIKALAGTGLAIPRIRAILRLIDGEPSSSLVEVLGHAIEQLPPYTDTAETDFPLAEAALGKLGQVYDPRYAAVAQLERALEALETADIPMSDERLAVYGRSVRAIAGIDIELMPTDSAEETVRYAVLGTAIYEPVIAAMRRLAHQQVAAEKFHQIPHRQEQQ